jgi:hypothetical protein
VASPLHRIHLLTTETKPEQYLERILLNIGFDLCLIGLAMPQLMHSVGHIKHTFAVLHKALLWNRRLGSWDGTSRLSVPHLLGFAPRNPRQSKEIWSLSRSLTCTSHTGVTSWNELDGQAQPVRLSSRGQTSIVMIQGFLFRMCSKRCSGMIRCCTHKVPRHSFTAYVRPAAYLAERGHELARMKCVACVHAC